MPFRSVEIYHFAFCVVLYSKHRKSDTCVPILLNKLSSMNLESHVNDLSRSSWSSGAHGRYFFLPRSIITALLSFRNRITRNKVEKYIFSTSYIYIPHPYSVFLALSLAESKKLTDSLTPWWCQAPCGLEKGQSPRHGNQTDYWKVRST